MRDNKYILAMYDVRGKQDYIFRGRKLKEIVGGSLVIRDIFKDELYPAADEYAKQAHLSRVDNVIYNYRSESGDTSFSPENFRRHLEMGYIGEVIYDGGGNFFILYNDIDAFREVNKIFTKRVLEHTYSLTVLCSCIEGVDFDNYTTLGPKNTTISQEELGDRERLYAENRKREAKINPQMPAQVLPFTQVDYANSLPLYKYNKSISSRITRESYRKYEKYGEVSNQSNDLKYDASYDENVLGNIISEKVLDNIVQEKGKDSWLAVMYIDGNNMGAKVQNVFRDPGEGELTEKKKISYETAIAKLRAFSDFIQKEYIDDRLAAIDKALALKYKNKEAGDNDYKRRLVIYAGDEINIILNAHDVYDAVKAYFKGFPQGGSACAGIAIFKSHTPYADAYRIAEECCETGKRRMKLYKMKEVSMIDFHYCQGVIGSDLDTIRERECGDIISKPWLLSYDKEAVGTIPPEKIVTCAMIEELVEHLNTCSRTNIKGLLDCAKNSEAELMTELTRMQLRRKNSDQYGKISDVKDYDGNTTVSVGKLRKMVYDIVSVYDLWFRK